ncbi:MAG: tRNA (adenosine(37)-N6)-dimethylallyltransferase MiaA [Lentihominibacter sp.]
MDKARILVIAGPTAVGKTEYAIRACQAFNGEIVSCDSMQIYKFMDIGSAKPTPDERKKAVHHLVDLVDPREDFSVAEYQKLALDAISDIHSRGRLPVISGGTGLYLNSILYDMDFGGEGSDPEYRRALERIASEKGGSVLHNMLRTQDPEAADSIHPNNHKKIIRALERLNSGEATLRPFSDVRRERQEFDAVLLGLCRDRAQLYDRINIRVDKLMEMGLVEEVRQLMKMGLDKEDISMKGIGYKEIFEYLEGRMTLDETVELIKKNTRHYAKRQLTWFKRYDKMKWYNLSEYLNDERAFEEIEEWLREKL